jgi:hypothetical protein
MNVVYHMISSEVCYRAESIHFMTTAAPCAVRALLSLQVMTILQLTNFNM